MKTLGFSDSAHILYMKMMQGYKAICNCDTREHLKLRIKLRGIPYAMPKEVYEAAEERYYDTSTSYYIAIKKLNYAGKMRTMAVTYNKHGNKIEIITIHPIKESQEEKRISGGRWMRIWI